MGKRSNTKTKPAGKNKKEVKTNKDKKNKKRENKKTKVQE